MYYGDEDGIAAVGATVPMGRIADPSDVGDVCLFLASPLARYVTGEQLVVHGGGELPAYIDAARTRHLDLCSRHLRRRAVRALANAEGLVPALLRSVGELDDAGALEELTSTPESSRKAATSSGGRAENASQSVARRRASSKASRSSCHRVSSSGPSAARA